LFSQILDFIEKNPKDYDNIKKGFQLLIKIINNNTKGRDELISILKNNYEIIQNFMNISENMICLENKECILK